MEDNITKPERRHRYQGPVKPTQPRVISPLALQMHNVLEQDTVGNI